MLCVAYNLLGECLNHEMMHCYLLLTTCLIKSLNGKMSYQLAIFQPFFFLSVLFGHEIFEKLTQPNPNIIDRVGFYFSLNRGINYQSIMIFFPLLQGKRICFMFFVWIFSSRKKGMVIILDIWCIGDPLYSGFTHLLGSGRYHVACCL